MRAHDRYDLWSNRARAAWLALRSGLTVEQKAFWAQNGYLVLPRHFAPEHVDEVSRYVDAIWARQVTFEQPITIDVYTGETNEQRVFADRAPVEARSKPYKLNDVYLVHPPLRHLILERRLAGTLAFILKGMPIVCNTLNLERGSRQAFHTDTLYMPGPTGVTGSPMHCNMVATWIALEDCSLDAGPLTYYPGSHLVPPYRFSHGTTVAIASEMPDYTAYMRRMVEERGLKAETFAARKGDVLIWHELLFHGGAPIKSPERTRKSLVTHYMRATDMRTSDRLACANGYLLNRAPHAVRAS